MVKYRGHARRYNYWRITRNCYHCCRVLLLGTIIVLILTCISIVSYSGAYSAMRFHISVQNIGEILDAFDVWKNIFNCASLHVITTTWCNLCDCKTQYRVANKYLLFLTLHSGYKKCNLISTHTNTHTVYIYIYI